MLDNLYSRIDFLRKGMEGLWARNQIIADNIANVDTNGYKAKDINFEQVFSKYLDKRNSDGYKSNVKDSDTYLDKARYSINEKKGFSVKANGNNVDMDKEMAYLAENAMKYDLVSQAMNFQLDLLKDVINEGKR